MQKGNPWISVSDHRFIGEGQNLRRQATLLEKIGEEPQAHHGYINFNIVKGNSAYGGILGQPVLKQVNIVIFLRYSHVRYSTNIGEISLKYNQEIQRRNCKSNKKWGLRAPKNIVAIVEMTNPEDKLKTNDSINHRINECTSEAETIKELKSFFVVSYDSSKALKIDKKVREDIKGLL